MVFGGIKALLDPRIPKERQAAALLRLRRYAGLEPGTTPLTKLAEMRTQERFSDKKLVGPYRGEVEQDLADAPRFIDGIAKLFAASDIKRSEEHTSELQSLMRISYAVFCLKKKNKT